MGSRNERLINSNTREIALEVIYQVDFKGAYANLALNRALRNSRLSKLDRSFITQLVYGTVKSRNVLDWALTFFSRHPLQKLPSKILCLLRLGAYQLLFLNKVPASAACNESVELAKKYGHRGTADFVNAVLRSLARNKEQLCVPGLSEDPVTHIALTQYHPEWLAEYWVEEFGAAEALALCRADNLPPPLTLRVNTLRTTPAKLAAELAGEGVESRPGKYASVALLLDGVDSVEDLRPMKEGRCLVQDEGSILVSLALAPAPNSVVVDACAAPGGKTTHLAQLMTNSGQVLAFDIHENKLNLVRENCARLGLTNVEVHREDARRLGQLLPKTADYLLIDAPCSGLGVLRRRPDIRWRKTPEKIAELSQLQTEILEGASPCVKDGGVLIYSTCTIAQEENQRIINRFLARHPEWIAEDLSPFLPAGLLVDAMAVEQAGKGCFQLLPHVHGTDGFFISRLRYREGAH